MRIVSSLKLNTQKLSGGVETLKTKFICEVKSADKCKFVLGDGKTYTKEPDSNGRCTLIYTYKKPGEYTSICYAKKDTKETTSDSCKQILTVKKKPKIEDTAGGLTIPIAISLITSIGIAYYVTKRLALFKP